MNTDISDLFIIVKAHAQKLKSLSQAWEDMNSWQEIIEQHSQMLKTVNEFLNAVEERISRLEAAHPRLFMDKKL